MGGPTLESSGVPDLLASPTVLRGEGGGGLAAAGLSASPTVRGPSPSRPLGQGVHSRAASCSTRRGLGDGVENSAARSAGPQVVCRVADLHTTGNGAAARLPGTRGWRRAAATRAWTMPATVPTERADRGWEGVGTLVHAAALAAPNVRAEALAAHGSRRPAWCSGARATPLRAPPSTSHWTCRPRTSQTVRATTTPDEDPTAVPTQHRASLALLAVLGLVVAGMDVHHARRPWLASFVEDLRQSPGRGWYARRRGGVRPRRRRSSSPPACSSTPRSDIARTGRSFGLRCDQRLPGHSTRKPILRVTWKCATSPSTT